MVAASRNPSSVGRKSVLCRTTTYVAGTSQVKFVFTFRLHPEQNSTRISHVRRLPRNISPLAEIKKITGINQFDFNSYERRAKHAALYRALAPKSMYSSPILNMRYALIL